MKYHLSFSRFGLYNGSNRATDMAAVSLLVFFCILVFFWCSITAEHQNTEEHQKNPRRTQKEKHTIPPE